MSSTNNVDLLSLGLPDSAVYNATKPAYPPAPFADASIAESLSHPPSLSITAQSTSSPGGFLKNFQKERDYVLLEEQPNNGSGRAFSGIAGGVRRSMEYVRGGIQKMPHLFSFSSERLKPTAPQRRTLLIILGLFVAILILWHVLRQPFDLLYPFKLETVAFHELGHALMAIITGGKVILVEINPNEGGKTVFSGGVGWAVLPAGYLGSSLIGALLLACGFSFKASKIAAGVLCGLMVLAIFWASTWFTRLVTVGFLVGILSLFIVRKGQFALWLKYVVLFMGVMSCCYSVWDILDDLILRKVNESDASAMSRMTGGWVPSQVFGLIWFLVSLFFGAGGVITGLYLFKDEERYDGAPTSI